MPNYIHCILIVDNDYINKREDARPSPTVSDIICSFKLKFLCFFNFLNILNFYIFTFSKLITTEKEIIYF